MKKAILFFLIILIPLTILSKDPAKIKVYFTNPKIRNHYKYRNNPENAFINLIRSSHFSFSGSFYDISSPYIVNELIIAKKRGVNIKLVTEKDNSDKISIRKLIDSGIQIVTDNRSGLMHNKFAISDGNIVWTGSYNITTNGAVKNNNNAIEISSKDLAEIFISEFNEMFYEKIFGNKKEIGPFSSLQKKYYVKIDNTNINAYFSPEDNIEKIILKRINKAKKSIHFMAFSFTSDKIGEAIIKKSKQGIKVKGIFEARGSKTRYSEYIKMKIEGIPVKKDKNRYVMHHKVIIIDGVRVITGSYNFSKNANKNNDENIIIIDNKKIADKYIREFYKLYK
jgi:phosphatidylserine/phosphatidylglycerophosphate/cardiolipin synthase-like enzyme